MRKEIRNLQQQLGMTMVYVTHDQIEAMSLADQVILMKGGKIEQKAKPSELYLEPATTFVARFIGTPPMNIIRMADYDGKAAISGAPNGPAILSDPARGLVLGLRPEEIRVAEAGRVKASIEAIEYHGADSILECRVGDQSLQVRIEGIRRLNRGDTVGLTWAPSAVHVFDEAEGHRVERTALAV
jgi:sn-glycerol 3-phosphate transport system ATP-binding protein